MIEQPPLKLDFRCTTCGYGVARLRPPERCPMCTGSRWQQHLQRHAARGSAPRDASRHYIDAGA